MTPLVCQEGPRRRAATRVVPQRCAPLSLEGDKGAFCLHLFAEVEEIALKCPSCGQEMERGTMHTRYYPFWTQQEELGLFFGPKDQVDLSPLDADNTSLFTRDPFPEYPDAMLCRGCGLVCFPCRPLEKHPRQP